ncbi:hypothetical protein DFP92_104178 [Yoonia sediminilitoris]|uniref:Uncharacterized protein n=1 Tax=Yoonia sediminilitoris TaxID=1286148 RepID=A0A2T6KIL0_9RHOB|nr:hypothetical protein C8N45_104179 [Yoonia sediminilitoris]RCW96168.1 hypothetical protein DFP92_104178 [Yoonia sediminilitoris]
MILALLGVGASRLAVDLHKSTGKIYFGLKSVIHRTKSRVRFVSSYDTMIKVMCRFTKDRAGNKKGAALWPPLSKRIFG